MGAEQVNDVRNDPITVDTWIGDTGASCHMRYDKKGMFNMKPINETITVGNNGQMRATMIVRMCP